MVMLGKWPTFVLVYFVYVFTLQVYSLHFFGNRTQQTLETPMNKGFLGSSKNYEFDMVYTNTVPNLFDIVFGILKKL